MLDTSLLYLYTFGLASHFCTFILFGLLSHFCTFIVLEFGKIFTFGERHNSFIVYGGAIQMQAFEPNYKNFPGLIKGIQVGRKIDRAVALHTLVGVGSAPGRGVPVVKYHLVYDDGTRTVFPVRNDIDVGGWYGFGQSRFFNPQGTGTLDVAKQITNEATANTGTRRYLYHFSMVNPNPSKVVSTIEIESMCTTKAPLILAITVE